MPRKGMRTIFFKASPPASSSPSPMPSPSHRHTFSDTLMDENIENAQALISKWDVSSDSPDLYSNNTTSLFTVDNRYEAQRYLNSIKDLQTAMQYYISKDPTSDKLVLAQNLMQIAMKRLEKEFYLILKSGRQLLDPESALSNSSIASSRSSISQFENESEEEDRSSHGDSISDQVESFSMIATSDLKAIAECMISSGYGKECVKIYKIIRKSVVDEGLYHLHVEKLSFTLVQKMDWEVLEVKIKSWINAARVAVKTLFHGERILCNQVFSSTISIGDSCFAEITREGYLSLFGFPENVAKSKKAPERIFRTLDLYEAMVDLWPEIESTFNSESTSMIRQQAINSLIRLGEAVRATLTEFESAISKDNSKSAVPGGGIHPLTRYVMNYLTFLTDYSGLLADILTDWPLTMPSSPLQETYFGSPALDDSNASSAISATLAWLILVMLCKLDGKAVLYKDIALSYLFLANNLQYVVNKVHKSNLRFLLGEDWIAKHEAKVRQYASNYERMGWSKVVAALPEINSTPRDEMITVHQVSECFKRFNSAFEEAYKKQGSWIVTDAALRDEIKVSLAKNLVRVYREFYEKSRIVVVQRGGIVGFAPDDLGNYLSDLFSGTPVASSVSSSSSSSSFSQSLGRYRGGRP